MTGWVALMGLSQDRTRGVAPERWSRDWIILVVFALVLVAIVANLIYIQVIRGPEYARLAESLPYDRGERFRTSRNRSMTATAR